MKRWRRWLAPLLLCGAILATLASDRADSAGLCGVFKVWVTGDVLTAADLNNSFSQAATTNGTVQCVAGYSASVTQMQVTTNPYPASAESLATSLAGELERLRYQLALLNGRTYWYQLPVEGNRPNLLLSNSSVERWSAGTSSAPDDWTLAGAGATVARDGTAANVKHGTYSVDVVRVGADATLSQTVTARAGGTSYFRSRTYTLGAWVRSTIATRAQIAIYDGIAQTQSGYHTGGGTFEYLTVTRTLSGTATELTARLQVNTGDTTVQFDGITLVEGYLAPVYTPAPEDRIGREAIGARAYNSLNISIANATATAVTLDTERFDTTDLHSTASNTARFTLPVAGVWEVGCSTQWAANATGSRRTSIRLNGATYLADARVFAGATDTPAQTVSTLYRVAATDYVECVVEQNSGGALNVLATANMSPEVWVYFLGP